jgi:ABC-type glycerol-3-phosphate transport system substrate-binding protein
MTKFAKIAAVLVAVTTLAACSTGAAQSESVVSGDSTFERAQNK